jgi:hypothetical protein
MKTCSACNDTGLRRPDRDGRATLCGCSWGYERLQARLRADRMPSPLAPPERVELEELRRRARGLQCLPSFQLPSGPLRAAGYSWWVPHKWVLPHGRLNAPHAHLFNFDSPGSDPDVLHYGPMKALCGAEANAEQLSTPSPMNAPLCPTCVTVMVTAARR